MRIGIISDIHGNLPALTAVLKAMPAVDVLLCAGDVVGYYPDVNEVCEALRRAGAGVVRGNHDAYVLGELNPDPSRQSAYRTDWTREQLAARNRAWLAALPVEMRFSFGRARIVLRHASPWDEETYLYRDSASAEKVRLEAGEFLLLGHTHIPMKHPAGDGWMINPGSVGQPRDYDPRAAFSILDTVSSEVELCRCSYDVAAYQQRLQACGWDEKTIQILSRRKPSP